eukprot:Skav219820  [mRNA]  locus=scaffold147:418227:422451:+ [translate_table: standard]
MARWLSCRCRCQEEALLERMVARLAVDVRNSGGKPFRRFKKWLEDQPPYDIVIDGANVTRLKANGWSPLFGPVHLPRFQYSQIDAVIDKLRESGCRVLLVLHPKWLREDADRTVIKRKKRKLEPWSALDQINLEGAMGSSDDSLEDQHGTIGVEDSITEAEREAPDGTPLAFIRKWKAPLHRGHSYAEQHVVVIDPLPSEPKTGDDWYWLFAALSSARRGARHVQVSNDHMRDHHWRMVGFLTAHPSNRAFLKWQGRHMTRVSIWVVWWCLVRLGRGLRTCKVTLTPPDLCAILLQVSDDGFAWHFPVPFVPSRAQQLSSGRPLPRKAR